MLATDSGGSAGATDPAEHRHRAAPATRGGTGRSTVHAVPADLEITRPPCERWDATAAAYNDQTVPAPSRARPSTAPTPSAARAARPGPPSRSPAWRSPGSSPSTSRRPRRCRRGRRRGAGVRGASPSSTRRSARSSPTAGTGPLDGRPRRRAWCGRPTSRGEPGGRRRGSSSASCGCSRRRSRGRCPPTAPAAPGPRRTACCPRWRHPATVVSTGTGCSPTSLAAVELGLRRTSRAVPTDAAGQQPGQPGDARGRRRRPCSTAVRTDAPLPAADQAADQATPSDVGPADSRSTPPAATGSPPRWRAPWAIWDSASAEVKNAGQPALDTVVRFSPDRAEQAASCSPARCPRPTPVPDPGSTGVLQLVLGRSFDGIVRAADRSTGAGRRAPSTAPAATCR